jgi:hypothetical protein
VPRVNASVAVANYIAGMVSRFGAGDWTLDASGKEILLSALLNPLGNDTAVLVTCSTGNCTFAESRGVTYASMGLCQACIDTSSLIPNNITSHGNNYNFTLPNGLALYYPVTFVSGPVDNDFSSESKLFTPEFADLAPNSISNITILTLTAAPCSDSPGYASCNNNNSIQNDLAQNVRAISLPPKISR